MPYLLAARFTGHCCRHLRVQSRAERARCAASGLYRLVAAASAARGAGGAHSARVSRPQRSRMRSDAAESTRIRPPSHTKYVYRSALPPGRACEAPADCSAAADTAAAAPSRAQLGHQRVANTVIVPRTAGAHKNGGGKCGLRRNTCKRLRTSSSECCIDVLGDSADMRFCCPEVSKGPVTAARL